MDSKKLLNYFSHYPIYKIPSSINCLVRLNLIKAHMKALLYLNDSLSSPQRITLGWYIYYRIKSHFSYVKNVKTRMLKTNYGLQKNNFHSTSLFDFLAKKVTIDEECFIEYSSSNKRKMPFNNQEFFTRRRSRNQDVSVRSNQEMLNLVIGGILAAIPRPDQHTKFKPINNASSFKYEQIKKWANNFSFIKQDQPIGKSVVDLFLPMACFEIESSFYANLNYWDIYWDYVSDDLEAKVLAIRTLFLESLQYFPNYTVERPWVSRNVRKRTYSRALLDLEGILCITNLF